MNLSQTRKSRVIAKAFFAAVTFWNCAAANAAELNFTWQEVLLTEQQNRVTITTEIGENNRVEITCDGQGEFMYIDIEKENDPHVAIEKIPADQLKDFAPKSIGAVSVLLQFAKQKFVVSAKSEYYLLGTTNTSGDIGEPEKFLSAFSRSDKISISSDTMSLSVVGAKKLREKFAKNCARELSVKLR